MTEIEKLVAEALEILGSVGIPTDTLSARRRVKMAKCFLAVAGLTLGKKWKDVIYDDPSHRLRSRDIIIWINKFFGENISPGSYDDIRRKDLVFPVEAGLILKSAGKDDAATNDGTRGYAINPDYKDLLDHFGTPPWRSKVSQFMEKKQTLKEALEKKRKILLIPVNVGGKKFNFTPGKHNALQKSIIEEFIPRFGRGARVLYVGDTADKFLFRDDEKLVNLGFFELSHDKLPDVVAYSEEKNWLFLIEAVHSANPITPMRRYTLEKLTDECLASVVYVTAFPDRATFRKFAVDVAWETEVWIADAPDHMIHFNGDKFLGPYSE